MPLEQKLHLRLSQKLVMTPTLQQAIKLLQMTKLELVEVVNKEMVENPTLEEGEESEEIEAAERPEAPPDAQTKTEELRQESWSDIEIESFFQDEYHDPSWRRENTEEREDYSVEATLTQPPDLSAHLLWQLEMSHAPERIRQCTEFLIGNVDDDGYLTVQEPADEVNGRKLRPLAVEDIEPAGYSRAEAEAALALLRTFDPPGVGATDLRHCLLLQLELLGERDSPATRVVREYWPLFLNRRYAELASKLGIDVAELQPIVEMIGQLEPRPGRAYSAERTIYVEPDVYIRKVGDDWVINLNDDGMPRLRINERYRRMLRGEGAANGEAASYIRDKLRSAVWLMKSLDQRQRTIYKVANSILQHQREFFERGVDALRPMVLRDVAQDIGMHESTVSRVVSNKYLQCARGLLPMKYFFHSGIETRGGADVSSHMVKQKIRELVDGEDTAKPLADATIVQKLGQAGINIARRTVAKYREEMGISSSSQRRKVF